MHGGLGKSCYVDKQASRQASIFLHFQLELYFQKSNIYKAGVTDLYNIKEKEKVMLKSSESSNMKRAFLWSHFLGSFVGPYKTCKINIQ